MAVSAETESGQLALSVVVVTYNEAERIRDCLTSIFAACDGLLSYEVILVDSNSTDGTVELASDYPVTILRIPDDDITTPAAGRYVGTEAARGERILFVDGDMVISRTWLEAALDHLEQPDVAGVDGHLNDPAETEEVQRVDAIRGVALYDREAFQSVGGFDPHLRSLEDIHLGFQLTTLGYELHRLPQMAATHPPRQSFSEPIRRWRRGYMVGTGQTVRASLRSPKVCWKHLRRLRYRLCLIGWSTIGFAVLTASLLLDRSLSLFGTWLVLSLAGFGLLVHHQGLSGGLAFLFAKVVGSIGLVRGLFITPRPPEAFPLDQIEQIQYGPVQGQYAHVA